MDILTIEQVIEALENNALKGSDELDWRVEMLVLAKCLRNATTETDRESGICYRCF